MLGYEETIKTRILTSAGITRPELAAELRIDVRTVDRNVTSLIEQGFVERRMVRRGPGRPIFQYFRTNSQLHFGAIQLTDSGIFAAAVDGSGQLVHKIFIDEFSMSTEIPATAAHKTAVLARMLETAVGARLNALTLVFSRQECHSRFAADVQCRIEETLAIPVFLESPLSVHAYAFRKNHPEYRRVLFLHFGFALELAMIDGETLAADNAAREAEFQQMPVGKDNLWHTVSLSTVMARIAASRGITFYSAPEINKLIADGVPETLPVIRQTEETIRYALQKIVVATNPDVVVMLALWNDRHILAMPEIVHEKLRLKSNKHPVDFRLLAETETDRLPGLRAAAATADYRSWSRFVSGCR